MLLYSMQSYSKLYCIWKTHSVKSQTICKNTSYCHISNNSVGFLKPACNWIHLKLMYMSEMCYIYLLLVLSAGSRITSSISFSLIFSLSLLFLQWVIVLSAISLPAVLLNHEQIEILNSVLTCTLYIIWATDKKFLFRSLFVCMDFTPFLTYYWSYLGG